MRFADVYLFETPIAYDDETEAKIGTIDKETNTKWDKAPPPNATIPQLDLWFKDAIKRGVLKDEQLGRGASKVCRFNENEKTVFKYNYRNAKVFGNQITNEVNVYKKHHTKYPDILPKFYKWGKNWVIQEYVKPVDSNISEFQVATGLPFIVWNDASSYISTFQNHDYYNIPRSERKSLKVDIQKFVNRNFEKDSYNTRIINKVLNNENLYEIIEFCFKTKVDLNDMHRGNLGVSPDKK